MAKKKGDLQYYEGVGRRKQAVARVRLFIITKNTPVTVNGLKINKGETIINGKNVSDVFSSEADKKRFTQAYELTNSLDRFATSILVTGGGPNGQLEAVIHGIARAMVMVDPETNKPLLKQYGLLTRDPRKRERRKVGTGGKARRQKQSPKR
jgi:small subunit ribosomal protein S9